MSCACLLCRGNLRTPPSIWSKVHLSFAHPSRLSPSAPPPNLLPPLHPRGAAPLVFHPAVARPPRGPTSRARPVPSPAQPLPLLAPRRSAPTSPPTTCLNPPNPRTRGARGSPRKTTLSLWNLVRESCTICVWSLEFLRYVVYFERTTWCRSVYSKTKMSQVYFNLKEMEIKFRCLWTWSTRNRVINIKLVTSFFFQIIKS